VKNYYKTLDCHPMMTDEEIRAKYRKLARDFHPDRPNGDADMFALVTAAHKAIATAKGRAHVRGLYALHAPACGACSGEGYSQRSKGFTSVVYTPCAECGGCGYLLEQAAKVRSYTRKK
jgi:DnaJ-class molecular chaperone